jgi:hypothetical protein
MKFSLIAFTAAIAVAFAAPTSVETSAGEPCTFSSNEKLNLGHNHDVNTGKIKYGTTVSGKAPQVGGAGCSPAWANGGKLDDNSPQKTRKECTGGKTCGGA